MEPISNTCLGTVVELSRVVSVDMYSALAAGEYLGPVCNCENHYMTDRKTYIYVNKFVILVGCYGQLALTKLIIRGFILPATPHPECMNMYLARFKH
jgi:hypothetical protein